MTAGEELKKIAAVILENPSGELLLYLRDNKPSIPYPHYWDLIGGHVEPGETIEEALEREVQEEIGIQLTAYTFIGKYDCWGGSELANCKYVFHALIEETAEELTLYEGERLQYFSRDEIPKLKIANMLKVIILGFLRDTYHWESN